MVFEGKDGGWGTEEEAGSKPYGTFLEKTG